MDASPTSPAAKKVDRKMVRCGWEQGPPKLRGLGHGSKRGGDGVAATKKIAWESVAMLVGQSPPNVRGPGIIPGGGFWGRQKTSQNIRTERDHRWTFGDCWAECSSNGKVWDRA